MKWTPEDNIELERLYNLGKSDEYITAAMRRDGKYSVAKQRTVLGFVKFKQKEGIKRAAKRVMPKMNTNFTVLFYKQDGMDHFAMVGEGNPKVMAQNIITRKGVGEVILLVPKSKLIMQQITEINL